MRHTAAGVVAVPLALDRCLNMFQDGHPSLRSTLTPYYATPCHRTRTPSSTTTVITVTIHYPPPPLPLQVG